MPKRNNEDGWVLTTAVILTSLMLLIALASMSIVDTQQKRAGDQRQREASLNLAEGVLFAQGFQLARHWPGTTTTAVAADCTSAAAYANCPSAAQVQKNGDNVDTRAATTWTSVVRDNGGQLATVFQPQYMNAAQSGTNATGQSYTCAAPCRWDANGDRKLWVEASTIVRGKPRTVVATLKLEKLAESTPRAAVTAGGINTVNNGSQVKIYAVGSNVVVRCDPSSSKCVSNQDGISPHATAGSPPSLMTPLQLERFKARAQADGTYYDGCNNIKRSGNDLDLRGAVVFVDNCTSYQGSLAMFPCVDTLPAKPVGGGNGLSSPCINSRAVPGLMIWHCGRLELTGNGNGTFIGVMYFANNSDNPTTGACGAMNPKQLGSTPPDCSGNKNSPENVFASSGGFGVWGALAIDGNGCLYAGSNGMQVQYDYNAFGSIASYGTVGLVQDTWRELYGG